MCEEVPHNHNALGAWPLDNGTRGRPGGDEGPNMLSRQARPIPQGIVPGSTCAHARWLEGDNELSLSGMKEGLIFT